MVVFPLISVAGCRLLFHIRSKERGQVLGVSNISRVMNAAVAFTEDVAMTRLMEFKTLSIQEREVPQERIEDGRELMEEEGDYPRGDRTGLENECISDQPQGETEFI
jgi:hypothetical protein